MNKFKKELISYSQNSLNEAERQRINERLICQILDHQISKFEGEYKSYLEALNLERMQSNQEATGVQDQEARNAILNRAEVAAEDMVDGGYKVSGTLLKGVNGLFSFIASIPIIISSLPSIFYGTYPENNKITYTC